MIHSPQRSLEDLLGAAYIEAVCQSAALLQGKDSAELRRVACEKVDFYPPERVQKQEELMERVGERFVKPFDSGLQGAPTASYAAAQNNAAAPLATYACFRIGEDGRLYFTGKSEHYHTPLGHGCPAYELVEKAKQLGIPNATHNNSRGYISRLLERRLIAEANGLTPDAAELTTMLDRKEPGLLNAVLNLETGSLAVEAALKMMLARFYPLGAEKAPYAGRIPVFLVLADQLGGSSAGYHGTTLIAQTLRGLWPDLLKKIEDSQIYKVVPVPLNDRAALANSLRLYNSGAYKTAGFCHEIILMNYGGIRLDEAYLHAAYELCRASDTPVLCDEIQSCAWYDELFLFRRYGLRPDFVAIGKGFPAGLYPASRLLLSKAFDNLTQFGALVTNGQEELASLAYLVTMEFIKENREHISETGHYYHAKVAALVAQFPQLCLSVEGDAHMTALHFKAVDFATQFCAWLNQRYCIDISAQTYKADCPPAALTKLPVVVTPKMVDRLIDLFAQALNAIAAQEAERGRL